MEDVEGIADMRISLIESCRPIANRDGEEDSI